MRKYKQEPYTVPPWIYNAIQVLRPAERLTVSEWAAKYRILPDGNAIPGPWSNSVTPYLVEIMDAFSDDTVEEIVFVKPTQVGGTSAMENMLGSLIAQDPAPTMVVYPSDDLAERTTESKLEPMVRSCKVLADKWRKNDSKKLALKFSDMIVYLTGANSPADLASTNIRNLFMDEVDKFPAASKKEADPVSLARERTKTYLSPSKNMQAALKNMGYESGQALLESKGLQGSLDALKDAVGGNELAFAGLFSSVEAQTAVLAMAGNQAENLTSKTAEMYEATGAANTAFERQTNTLAYDIQMVKNLGANFLTQLGTNILPYVREFAEAALPVVSEALEKIGSYMTGTIIPAAETAVKWISEHRTLILALAAGIATAVAAYKAYKVAITAYNAVMAVYKVVTAASATGTFTLAGAMTALNLPVLAVVAAIGLAVAAGILIYKNWDKIKAKAAELGAKISEVWGNIKTGVSEAVANLVSAFQSNFPLLSAYLSGWWESVSAAWENVKAIFANIIDFVQNVFAGNWSAAWDNIVAIFGNVFGMIVNLAKAPINGVISAINWVLEKINSISVTIPDWVPGVGGKTLGFNIPTIPALAAGGIATAPTLAQIGEGGEPEAVLPLSKLAALLDEWTKPKPKPGGGTGGGGETVVFSPVFNFYGGTPSREEAEEAGRISFAEFKKLYRQMKAEEKRKQFSPA